MGRIGFEKVNKVYPNGVHAIHDFDLTVEDGEFIVLVGPSGCGKSTVLRMLGGLEQITDGTLTLDGKVINKTPPVERDIAIVFQDYALYGNLSVYDNVGISMKIRHEKETDIYDRVLHAAETTDIVEYLNRLPRQLSGGQKQRVALARAIIRRPKAFLMDEPLSNLDAKLRNATRVEIVKLQRELGVTTVYVTHDQTEAMTMADRIVVMREGRIQQVGTPSEIYRAPANLFVAGFIGVPQMDLLEGAVRGGRFHFGENSLRLPERAARALAGAEGRKLTLGLRPESFLPARAGEENALPVTVERTEYMGSYSILHADLGGWRVECRMEAAGPTAFLTPDLERAHFFDSETGEAVLHMEVGDDHGQLD